MSERPVLNKDMDSKIFLDYYYLKEELVDFCRDNGLPCSGGKNEITERIAYYLETGKILKTTIVRKKAAVITNTIIRETHIKNMYWKPHSLTD